jgi:hypothetical protein
MFTRLLIQTANVLERLPASFDEYGNETATFAGSGDTQISLPCRIQELTGTEDNAERETITRLALGFFEPNVEMTAYDRIEVEGTVWEVVGNPRRLNDSTGPHHIEVDLREVVL